MTTKSSSEPQGPQTPSVDRAANGELNAGCRFPDTQELRDRRARLPRRSTTHEITNPHGRWVWSLEPDGFVRGKNRRPHDCQSEPVRAVEAKH